MQSMNAWPSYSEKAEPSIVRWDGPVCGESTSPALLGPTLEA